MVVTGKNVTWITTSKNSTKAAEAGLLCRQKITKTDHVFPLGESLCAFFLGSSLNKVCLRIILISKLNRLKDFYGEEK